MRLTTTLVLALLLSACGSTESPPEAEAAAPEGREETRNIRNTEAIGYAGDAIADKVDAALDANDERKAKLDAELEAME